MRNGEGAPEMLWGSDGVVVVNIRGGVVALVSVAWIASFSLWRAMDRCGLCRVRGGTGLEGFMDS